jgi:outer membrane immunogenic protein
MNKFALATICCVLLAAPAKAADVEVAPEPLVYDWTGFYVGAHVGYGEAQVDGEHEGEAFGLDPNGILGGVHAGFNWQLGSFVIGTEGDFSWGNWDDSAALTGPDAESASAEVDWLATLRARLGLALDNFLIYGTVGAAWADAEASIVDPGLAPSTGSVDFDDVGLVAGGGVEWGVSESLSWKLEGLWFNFDDTVSTGSLVSESTAGDFIKLDDAWVVQTGVRYNF